MHWHVGDATHHDFGGKRFDLWHDRAVFHFLTNEEDQRAYVERVRQSVKPGGHVLMATFGPEGPTECSGLAVVRYDEQHLRAVFGEGFEMLGSERVAHLTPTGAKQQFLYYWCRRSPSVASQGNRPARRLVALLALLALGTAIGTVLEALTGSPASYFAIPVLLAIGWLVVANPQACNGAEQRPRRHR